jgi:hypothetical protein
MAAKVKLTDLIEALELAADETSYYLDRETGKVHLLTDDDLRLAEDDEEQDDLPDWQREQVELARKIVADEGKRYLDLPSKFDVHDWEIMDRFSLSIEDAPTREDLHRSIRGAGAFRMFKRLLDEYDLWDAWNRFQQAELRQMAIEWCEENGLEYVDS